MPQSGLLPPWLSPFVLPGVRDLLNGDVSQLFRIFSPSITVNGSGDPELESAIVRDVATYGSQLGQLNEIVLELAARAEVDSDAVDKLRAIQLKVADKKREYSANAEERARDAMAELDKVDSAALTALMKQFTAKRQLT